MGLKYAEILDVRTESGTTEWVTVLLEDGTSLEMTSNHPVQPLLDKGIPEAVRATDLRPGSDHLMVFKTMPMLVQEVAVSSSESEERVFLTLRQPERHSLFVASSPNHDSTGPPVIQTIAVGSADARARGYDVKVRQTFINIEDADTGSGRALKRSNSAPPGCLHTKVAPTISTTSYRSTTSESASIDSANILLAPPVQPVWQSGEAVVGLPRTSAAQVALSEVMSIRSMGVRSIGAIGHAQGNCKTCLFANRATHAGGQKCWKGVFCDRCHENHDLVPRKKPKTGHQREREKLKMLRNGDEEKTPPSTRESQKAKGEFRMLGNGDAQQPPLSNSGPSKPPLSEVIVL
jgi:hypothetical protein